MQRLKIHWKQDSYVVIAEAEDFQKSADDTNDWSFRAQMTD